MAKSSKTKAPAIAVKVPQSRLEAASTLLRIGLNSRRVGRMEADMNDELAAVKRRYAEAAAPIAAIVSAETEALQVWCAANRESICPKGLKTADLGTGTVSWRLKPPSVRISGPVEDFLDHCRRLGLPRFIRTKEEANREAMQAEPEVARTIPGVTIGSGGEDFIVEPFEAELERAAA